MNRIIIWFPVALLLYACGGKAKVEVEPPAPVEEIGSNTVSLTAAQMVTAGIELGSIAMKNLKTAIKANGQLTVPNQNKAFITSVSSGVIKTLLIQPGMPVRKGQVVATISNPDVAELQKQLQVVNAEIRLNEIELKRQKELVEGNAAPLKNVQRVETELATQRAERNALQSQMRTMGISSTGGAIMTTFPLVAPISGTISNVTAQIGSNVDASSPIAEIVNNSQLHLDLFVYEKDLPRLHANQIIHFTLTNNPGTEYDAQIYSKGTAFANESKTIPVHAVVKGDKTGLIEGMSITALISIGEAVVPAVPSEAIVNNQGQDYIFVQKADSSNTGEYVFERLQVVKGASDIGYTEITPLKPTAHNAQVIIKGAFFAMAKMTNTGEEE